MKLLFSVNQKEALLRGINAPSSSVSLDIDPADLSEAEREVLAEVLVDGYDCTRYSVRIGGDARRLELIQPTVDGLHEVLADVFADRAAYAEDQHAKQVLVDAEIDQAIAAGPVRIERFAQISSNGELSYTTYEQTGSIKVQKPTARPVTDFYRASERASERYQEYLRECEKLAQAELEASRPALVDLQRTRIAEQEKRRRQVAAEIEAIKQKLSPDFLRRYEAGYASDTQFEGAVIAACLAEHGFSEAAKPFQDSEAVSELTDAEFRQLEKVRSTLKEGFKAEPYEISYYRPATGAEDDDAVDSDGEVKAWDRCIVVTWEQAGYFLAARVPFEE